MVNYSRKTPEVLLGQACAVMVSDKHWGGGGGLTGKDLFPSYSQGSYEA